MTNPLTGPFLAYASRLRFPTLFKITLVVFLIDLFIPDFTLIDDVLLGLGALLFASWQKRQEPVAEERPIIEHEPPPPPPK
jgi:hypothetical protein